MREQKVVTLRDALNLHGGRIQHLHWTTDIKDKAGTVIGVQHHHFLHERGLTTGIYSTSRTAREDLAHLLIGYYPEMQGSLVEFGGRRGFKLRTTLSDEERKLRELEKQAEEGEVPARRKRPARRPRHEGESMMAEHGSAA